MIEGGIIKDSEDARKHLDACRLTIPNAEVTYENAAKILLSLFITSTTKRTVRYCTTLRGWKSGMREQKSGHQKSKAQGQGETLRVGEYNN